MRGYAMQQVTVHKRAAVQLECGQVSTRRLK